MAETLTFENTQEATSIENLNADEQDSLQVGEAMQEAQDNLLAGKYKDAQELDVARRHSGKRDQTQLEQGARLQYRCTNSQGCIWEKNGRGIRNREG